VQASAVIEHFDVVGHGEPGPGAVGEGLLVVHLVLQRPEALGRGAVPAHTGSAGAGADAVGGAEPGELRRGALGALVTVEDRVGCTWPWVIAMARASVTRLARM
jgi:hypothetical protein